MELLNHSLPHKMMTVDMAVQMKKFRQRKNIPVIAKKIAAISYCTSQLLTVGMNVQIVPFHNDSHYFEVFQLFHQINLYEFS